MSHGLATGMGVAGLGVPDYVEVAWMTAPSDAGQSVSANTDIQLNLNTIRTSLTGASLGGTNGSQVTLPAGTYYFQAKIVGGYNGTAYPQACLMYLRNVTDSNTFVSGIKSSLSSNVSNMEFDGQFTISATKTFELRFACEGSTELGKNPTGNSGMSLSTPGIDQRFALRFWRYAQNLLYTPLSLGGGGGGYTDYLCYSWRTAPNAATQSITNNTITTLTLDTEVADTGNHGSISSNQVTLDAGSYYFEADHSFRRSIANQPPDALFRLYNVTDSLIVECDSGLDFMEGSYFSGKMSRLKGSFTITSSKTFRLEVAYSQDVGVGSSGQTAFTLSTASAQDRTKLQLWKK